MLALTFAHGRASLAERPCPVPGPGEALLKVRMAGICRTDIELLEGYYDFAGIPGHEFVAQVVTAPDAPGMVGRRVTADINIGCGACPGCAAGDARHCPERTVVGIKGRDGALAQFLALPLKNLHVIDESIPDQEAVFAEPLAAALQITQQVHITGRMRVLVQGDGKLGLLAALALRHFAPDVTLLGRHAGKLALAVRAGVSTALLPGPDERAAFLAGLGRFDLVVEATGRPEGLDQALSLTRPRGVLVAKTTSRLPATFNLARLVVDEISLIGSRCGDTALALDFLKDRRVDVRPLATAVFPFDRVIEALDAARAPGAGKILVDMRDMS